jgi:hypothetical protein
MPTPLRQPTHRTKREQARRTIARPLAADTIRRKLAGDDTVDAELMGVQAAFDLEPDTEAKLEELRLVTHQENELSARRIKLRDELTPLLTEGSRGFVSTDGEKYYGYTVPSELTIVDMDLLKQLVDPEVYNEIAREKADLTAFRHAVAAGRISAEVLVKVTSFKAKAPYVRFGKYER